MPGSADSECSSAPSLDSRALSAVCALGLCIVISDPDCPNVRYFAAAECPAWICSRFTHTEHWINQLETLVAVSALLTFPDLLRGRRVLHHIDNHSAISCTVHGYSSKVDLADLANMFNVAAALLVTPSGPVDRVRGKRR